MVNALSTENFQRTINVNDLNSSACLFSWYNDLFIGSSHEKNKRLSGIQEFNSS